MMIKENLDELKNSCVNFLGLVVNFPEKVRENFGNVWSERITESERLKMEPRRSEKI